VRWRTGRDWSERVVEGRGKAAPRGGAGRGAGFGSAPRHRAGTSRVLRRAGGAASTCSFRTIPGMAQVGEAAMVRSVRERLGHLPKGCCPRGGGGGGGGGAWVEAQHRLIGRLGGLDRGGDGDDGPREVPQGSLLVGARGEALRGRIFDQAIVSYLR